MYPGKLWSYKASKQCSHPQGYYPTFEGVAQHIRYQHPDGKLVKIPYEVDPDRDGTAKIPQRLRRNVRHSPASNGTCKVARMHCDSKK